MNFVRLFYRDCAYHRKAFLALSAAAALTSAILTGALLIGDCVRGSLNANLERDTAFVRTRLSFAAPISMRLPGGVLHANGFLSSGVRVHLYAFSGETTLRGREVYGSQALARVLKLKPNEVFTLRVQTIPAIPSESLMGRPPELRQFQLIYCGNWADPRESVNFETPQLPAANLFVNQKTLAAMLGLPADAINEVWSKAKEKPTLPDEAVWALSQLYLDSWQGRAVLNSRAFFLPARLPALFPEASRGVLSFAESLAESQTPLRYFFVGALEGDLLPVERDHALLSDVLPEKFPNGGELTYFATDAFRKLERKRLHFAQIGKAPDAKLTADVFPQIPGLTDVAECSRWDAEIPIDLSLISEADKDYWRHYRSKPKLYLNFAQAQALFSPGRCNLLVFPEGVAADSIKAKVIASLRDAPELCRRTEVTEKLRAEIAHGVSFAPLFLGLSLFIILSALLVLSMLVHLQLFDRAEEVRILQDYTGRSRKIARFLQVELLVMLLPGLLAGLPLGILLCRFQLLLLEHNWNGIVLMDHVSYYASTGSFLIALGTALVSSALVTRWSSNIITNSTVYCFAHSFHIVSAWSLGALCFVRKWRQYRLCIALLVLGFLGTLGVGAFGIRNRGEDGFGYRYVAETALPVVPTLDKPFPSGGLPIRVKSADSADCSNILQAETPTVYGCDLQSLASEVVSCGDGAAADAGSLRWIMKKKAGDAIHYPRGRVTIRQVLRSSVFQRGILVDRAVFERLFPEVQGAQFFLIRDKESAEAYREFLAPYGVTLKSVDEFMQEAERFQNRYLAIFLQLGVLGFILGIGALLLLMVRNLAAAREQIQLLRDSGVPVPQVCRLFLAENLCLYLTAAVLSGVLLVGVGLGAHLHWGTLIFGWLGLTALGILLITVFLAGYFRRQEPKR